MNALTKRSLWPVTLTSTLLVIGSTVTLGQEPSPNAPAAVSVRGTSTLVGQLSPGVATTENGVISVRDNLLVTIERSSDARTSGRATISVNFDAYPDVQGGPGATQVRYGTMRLENPGGAWSGRFSGRLDDVGFMQTYWLVGEDGYEGLSYVVTAGGSGRVWWSQGLIFPGEIPPMSSNRSFGIEGPAAELPAA